MLMVGHMAMARIRQAFLRRDRPGGLRWRERSFGCGTCGSRRREIRAEGGCRAAQQNGGAAT